MSEEQWQDAEDEEERPEPLREAQTDDREVRVVDETGVSPGLRLPEAPAG